MLSDEELSAAIGRTAYGPDGQEIGKVEHFLLDNRTGNPTWVAVTTGLFGTKHSIVPVLDASFTDGALRVRFDREAVRHAPRIQGTDRIAPEEEEELRRHYGLGSPAGEDAATAGRPAEDAGDGSMIRSEERLRISTERVAARRVRVVKYVVTEEVQVTVPLRREEIRIEEVPLDAADDGPGGSLVTEGGLSGPADRGTTGEPGMDTAADRDTVAGMDTVADRDTAADRGTVHSRGGLPEEIVLHREEPVFSVRVVPAERVRLRTEAVAGEETITAQVRRERIEVVETPAPGSDQRQPSSSPPREGDVTDPLPPG